jgi:D-amino-acid dehydrogenase
MSALATDAGRQPVSMGVLAAGACSGRRCRQLGHEMPLESERDYNVAFATPGASTRIQAMWRRRVSVASPLEMGMRFAETVELASLKAPPEGRRAAVLLRHSETMILGRRVDQVSRRMVHRPGTPESIPVINPSPHRSLLSDCVAGQGSM